MARFGLGLFRRKRTAPIRVNLNVRAFVDGQMVRLNLGAQASDGDTLARLLKRLGREGEVDSKAAQRMLKQRAGVTVLHNGRRLSMREAARTKLADGDEVSVLTPMAGG